MKKNKIIDIVCVALVGALFGSVVLLNLFQKNRPTESESEKRMLETMPEFSWQALTDGSYFAGISAFISDTFIERDRMVALSRRLDTLKGFDYAVGGGESFVLLTPNTDTKPEEPEDDGTSDAFAAAFEALKNQQEQQQNTADPTAEPETTPEAEEPQTPQEPTEAAAGTPADAGQEIVSSVGEEPEPPETEPEEPQPDETEAAVSLSDDNKTSSSREITMRTVTAVNKLSRLVSRNGSVKTETPTPNGLRKAYYYEIPVGGERVSVEFVDMRGTPSGCWGFLRMEDGKCLYVKIEDYDDPASPVKLTEQDPPVEWMDFLDSFKDGALEVREQNDQIVKVRCESASGNLSGDFALDAKTFEVLRSSVLTDNGSTSETAYSYGVQHFGEERLTAALEEYLTAAAEPDEPEVTGLHLSRKSLSLTVGSGAVLNATVDTKNPNGATVRWGNTDKNVATISINPNGGIDVKAVGVGKCTITCSWGDSLKETCEVTVKEITVEYTPPAEEADQSAEFLTSGLFIYGDAVYTQAYFSSSGSSAYASTAAYYQKLFGCRVSEIIAPVSAMVIDNPSVKSKIQDQGDILDQMNAYTDANVNFVNVYPTMYEHRNEYLFFRTDHHWTQLGAYYAYTAFAESVGLEPTPLSSFNHVIRNESYSGSMYNFTLDARVLNFSDVIEAYYPTKEHTMTVTTSSGYTNVYDTSIISSNKTYVTFIAGDNPYTVINVPDNPQDKNVLVLKDSFGNAFVPYLCEHYGNIIVADVRSLNFNLYEHLKDYGLTDIIFINNIQAANTYSWSRMYMKAVGVSLP